MGCGISREGGRGDVHSSWGGRGRGEWGEEEEEKGRGACGVFAYMCGGRKMKRLREREQQQ